MKYTMTKPCNFCPFVIGGLAHLGPDRAEAIGGQIVDFDGCGGRSEFVCHKTGEAEEDGDIREKRDGSSVHCAGALIFAEKQEAQTQMMRIAERLGMYDPSKLDKASFDRVFDNLDDMIEANS